MFSVLQKVTNCNITNKILLHDVWCHNISQRFFYDWRTRSETIFALATLIHPSKGSPLGIIRVSGSQSSHIVKHLTGLQTIRHEAEEVGDEDASVRPGGLRSRSLLPRRATLTKIIESRVDELIDIGVVLWFPKPNSYTGEDVCELHVHGSQAIIKRIMSTLGCLAGVRPADPGEFTRRAVENGKLSLIQAESIPELISAQTDQQRKLALRGLVGTTRKKYDAWIQELIRILAHLEASIDFGEDELIGEERVVSECIQSLNKLVAEISQFVEITSKCRDLAQMGARVSILGRPNAGKSTLMNMLCRREKSIVSDLSGTTRDVIEHSFDFNGHTLTLSDTAGLRDLDRTSAELSPEHSLMKLHDNIEREGIRRALSNADEADLLLYIVDGSQLNDWNEQELAERLINELGVLSGTARKKAIHLVINKLDLNPTVEQYDLKSIETKLCDVLTISKIQISTVSCRTEKHIDLLVGQISDSLDAMRPKLDGETSEAHPEYINERHLALLGSTLRHLHRAAELKIKNIDEMAQHIRESVDYLSRIVGTVSNEQIFDVIFRDFCIGK